MGRGPPDAEVAAVGWRGIPAVHGTPFPDRAQFLRTLLRRDRLTRLFLVAQPARSEPLTIAETQAHPRVYGIRTGYRKIRIHSPDFVDRFPGSCVFPLQGLCSHALPVDWSRRRFGLDCQKQRHDV